MPRRPKAERSFPNRLREVRLSREKSLAWLAERAGKPLSSVQRFETGGYQLKLSDARVFARVLGVDVAELLGERAAADYEREAELLTGFRRLNPIDRDRLLAIMRTFLPSEDSASAAKNSADSEK